MDALLYTEYFTRVTNIQEAVKIFHIYDDYVIIIFALPVDSKSVARNENAAREE